MAAVGQAVINGGASAIGYEIINRILAGNFNPDFKKEARKQMRYIQQKYSLAYGGGLSGEDPCAIIQKIDPQSKILMTPDGKRPANPFPDERAFEDSLQMNFHPVSGHQGRFVASHAMAAIGVIIDYQNARKARMWIPGVINPGRPNDYINLFLEESKTWLRNQLTLDSVHSIELKQRADYYAKLKNDNYYWCFPIESESCNIHKVIDYIHERVQNAYEIVSREERNKSLQTLFKELNDHTTNIFEFGKLFLGYLLCTSTKAGANLLNNAMFDGKTYETGKLHKLLEVSTELVFKTYVQDMDQSNDRLNAAKAKALAASSGASSKLEYKQDSRNEPLLMLTNGGVASSDDNNSSAVSAAVNTSATSSYYIVSINEYEEPSTLNLISGAVYLVEMCDPKGYAWIVRKTYTDFESLHTKLSKDATVNERKIRVNGVDVNYMDYLNFPANKVGTLTRKKADYDLMCDLLAAYLLRLLSNMHDHSPSMKALLCSFIDVKHLIISEPKALRHAEGVPNVFVSLKDEFKLQLVAKKDSVNGNTSNSSSNSTEGMSKSTQAFKSNWGIEWTIKIFEAYALLQRMASILGWTLEINHFFISMFGNTLSFSKLPLRSIILTQKDIMSNFLQLANELYAYACKLNTESQYKWHKNLQITEHELSRVKYHVEQALSVINLIDTEHLDYDAQMRRLEDVHARFQPLMNRVDFNLVSIQQELGLPRHEPVNDGMLMGNSGSMRGNRVEYAAESKGSSDRPLLTNGRGADANAGADEKYSSPQVEELPSDDVEEGGVTRGFVNDADVKVLVAYRTNNSEEGKTPLSGSDESQVCVIC